MVKLKGIDVSVWNGNINWSQAKKEIDFAILRAGYGRETSQKDQKFDANYNGCKANGIPMGAYWYNYAKTPDDAKKEATACIKILKGKTFDYPVWYDIEEPSVLSTGKENVSVIAKVFCEALKEAGYKVGIYSSYSGLKNNFTDEVKGMYDVWVAHVGNGGAPLSETGYPGHKEIWQYSWKGNIAGINGDVDEDWCYVDYLEKKEEPVKEEKVEEKKPEPKKEEKKKPEKTIDVYYAVYSGCWYSTIKNYDETTPMGYAGLDTANISGLTARATEGTLKYRVHVKGSKWLNWISESNSMDWGFGVAGIKGQVIDGIQLNLEDVPGYQVEYRVSTAYTKDYLPWVRGLEDYAGLFGQPIDKIQIRIVKV